MTKREKIRYEIDRLNRLWMQELDRDGLPLGPPVALEGSFQTRDNALLYRLWTIPTLEGQREIPRQIHLTGRWSLTSNHDLALSLDQAHSQREGDLLVLKGTLIYAESDALGFAITTRKKGGQETRILRLTGRWEADPQNRLTFHVDKEKGKDDLLRLEAAWEVGNQNELIYRYTKRPLDDGSKGDRELSFRGIWELSEADRLTYRLDLEGKSAFRFRGTVESQSLLAKEGAIRYQIGMEAAGRKRPTARTVTLFGKWKVNHDLSLDFELTRQEGKAQRLRFGTTHRLSGDNEISFFLEDERGKPLGLEIRFRKADLGVELFLRLQRRQKDELIEAGGRIPF